MTTHISYNPHNETAARQREAGSVCLCQHTQRGAVLMTSLIFLVILTLLGFSTTRNVIQQEHIARNTRDHDLAFQAADAALKAAENCIRNFGSTVATSCGLFTGAAVASPGGLTENYLLTTANEAWWIANGVTYDTIPGVALTPLLQVTQQPRFVVAQYDTIPSSLNVGSSNTVFYQVTAKGYGVNANTQTVVQSIFVR